jgi:hypothetical protein
MTTDSILILVPAMFVVAFLYSIMGHAGASGYIAVMALVGMSPATIKPTTPSLLLTTWWKAWPHTGPIVLAWESMQHWMRSRRTEEPFTTRLSPMSA